MSDEDIIRCLKLEKELEELKKSSVVSVEELEKECSKLRKFAKENSKYRSTAEFSQGIIYVVDKFDLLCDVCKQVKVKKETQAKFSEKMPKLPEERTEAEFLGRMKKRSEILKKRYSITERQLQELIRLEHHHSRECLAVAIRKQEPKEAKKNGKGNEKSI